MYVVYTHIYTYIYMIIRLTTLFAFLKPLNETTIVIDALLAEAKMLGRMADFGKLQGFFMLFQVIGGFLGTLITGDWCEKSTFI